MHLFRWLIASIDQISEIKDRYLQSAIRVWAHNLKLRYRAKKMFWYEQYIGFVIEPLIIKDIVNPPNLITLIRIILTGVVMLLLFNQSYGLAVIIFIIASFLDLIDGPMARALGMITNTGKMLDPLADKILLASVLIPLGYHNLPSWLFWSIVSLESFLIIIATIKIIIRHLPYTMATQANILGKIKIILELVGAGLLIIIDLAPTTFRVMAIGLLTLALPFALGSTLGYLFSIKKIR
ncbi:MAG: hypothetical protein COX77_04095 [Candidatus Komeilibacteria bacterium CG_4_10_14_0_2_um_filter_37_10]|uniref:CDP-alcohol phosphatidyltransferase family protein n=1 Tax=Candidatus Komeilibacteria bacterium CG_4_10_14_0_2_um_filter_37_10 TaxID=1974470 RepID=A0A2M7VDQ8_9BACT|nr:MAG: hypothetical protein COX77_04095 [Candidatus Komeilibacteria bacterium CG_4_10_14_0_2_um_filter_37_10]